MPNLDNFSVFESQFVTPSTFKWFSLQTKLHNAMEALNPSLVWVVDGHRTQFMTGQSLFARVGIHRRDSFAILRYGPGFCIVVFTEDCRIARTVTVIPGLPDMKSVQLFQTWDIVKAYQDYANYLFGVGQASSEAEALYQAYGVREVEGLEHFRLRAEITEKIQEINPAGKWVVDGDTFEATTGGEFLDNVVPNRDHNFNIYTSDRGFVVTRYGTGICQLEILNVNIGE